jgi:cobalt-zinc-cadmium efflux system outer membrane protein
VIPGAVLSLEELERLALANNPTVSEVQANLRATQGLAKQAGLYPNPTVGYYGDEIRGGSVQGGKQGGFVSQTIVLGGKLHAARRVAEVQANEAQTSVQMQHLRVVNNVRVLFYRVLAAQRMLDVRERLAKLAAESVHVSQQLGNVGQADQPDILQAEVEEQQAEANVHVAQQNLQSLWRMLAAITGKADLSSSQLSGDFEALPDLKYAEWLAKMQKESPEVLLAQQEILRSQASLAQARKAPIPDLQVTGIVVQNFEPLAATPRAVGVEGGVQIGVQLPLFNRNQGAVAAARALVESSQSDLARLKLEKQRALASLFRDYDSARSLARQYQMAMLPRARRAFELYQKNYESMAGAYPQVLISQRTLFQLEAEYVQALDTGWQTALRIRGFDIVDGLSEPTAPGVMSSSQAEMGNGGTGSPAALFQ